MKHLIKLSIMILAITFVLFAISGYAQDENKTIEHGKKFVDHDGDGFNDNAPDHDNDGVPNGQDPDYVPQNPERSRKFGFIDEDNDGINDRMQDADNDGIKNCEDEDWVRPQDGTGNRFRQQGDMHRGNRGKGAQRQGFKGNRNGTGEGTGECDGTGPKGSGK